MMILLSARARHYVNSYVDFRRRLQTFLFSNPFLILFSLLRFPYVVRLEIVFPI